MDTLFEVVVEITLKICRIIWRGVVGLVRLVFKGIVLGVSALITKIKSHPKRTDDIGGTRKA